MVERTSSRREEKKSKDKPARREEKQDQQDAIMLEDRELVIDTSEKIEIVQTFD
jgi:hypothetical protein